jgi:type VI secretion system protein ImpF
MPDRAVPRERFLPCLLDRLTDLYPKATREGREQRVVSMSQYREAVLRDLEWLLNSECNRRDDAFQEFDLVKRSVLCYGVYCLGGTGASTRNLALIEENVRDAILRFEPRISPETLSVSLVRTAGEGGEGAVNHNVVCLEITGELWAEPMPEHLFIRTELDLHTGSCGVQGR